MTFDASQLSGEIGGLLAGAWGAGAAMTYRFTKRIFGARIEELKAEIAAVRDTQVEERQQCRDEIAAVQQQAREDMAKLGERIDELVDRYMAGVDRQREQVRRSAEQMLERE